MSSRTKTWGSKNKRSRAELLARRLQDEFPSYLSWQAHERANDERLRYDLKFDAETPESVIPQSSEVEEWQALLDWQDWLDGQKALEQPDDEPDLSDDSFWLNPGELAALGGRRYLREPACIDRPDPMENDSDWHLAGFHIVTRP